MNKAKSAAVDLSTIKDPALRALVQWGLDHPAQAAQLDRAVKSQHVQVRDRSRA